MLSEDEWACRWPNFSKREVYSPETLASYQHILCPHSLDKLQLWREMLGVRLFVNFGDHNLRGVRSVRENETINNFAKESMHIMGRAFDVSSPDMNAAQLYSVARESKLWQGLGLYRTWVHVDTRASSTLTVWVRND